MPHGSNIPNLHCYEQLLEAAASRAAAAPFSWPPLSEDAACGLCYTSGTTGNPKVCFQVCVH